MRELREELGIVIGRTSALLEVHHDYGDKTVLLDVHVVWDFSGEARGLEDQPLAWVTPQDLASYAFPAANMPIVAALREIARLVTLPVLVGGLRPQQKFLV